MLIPVSQAVIVEGKDDKALLDNVISGTVIIVNGFAVYKDKAKLRLIRRYAETVGVILLTDSDNAGRQIRNYIAGYLANFPDCRAEHMYVPNLKEVEDTDVALLREKFAGLADSRAPADNEQPREVYDRARLFELGLLGGKNSAAKRREFLREQGLPENLSVTALLDALNSGVAAGVLTGTPPLHPAGGLLKKSLPQRLSAGPPQNF